MPETGIMPGVEGVAKLESCFAIRRHHCQQCALGVHTGIFICTFAGLTKQFYIIGVSGEAPRPYAVHVREAAAMGGGVQMLLVSTIMLTTAAE